VKIALGQDRAAAGIREALLTSMVDAVRLTGRKADPLNTTSRHGAFHVAALAGATVGATEIACSRISQR
jgi:hypothetical protein